MRLLLRLAYNALRLITWPFWGLVPLLRLRATRWVSLRVHGRVPEVPPPDPPWPQRMFTRLRPTPVSVAEVRRLAHELARSPRIEGVLVSLESVHAGWANLQALHAELLRLRATGKRVVVMLPQGADQRELWLASAADTVHTTPPAAFSALGPVAVRPYLARLLAKLGVEVQVFAQGDFKTAAESLSLDRMSEPEREQLNALLETIQTRWVLALSGRPRLGESGARKLLELGPFSPEQARGEGLVDTVHFTDELEKELGLDRKEPRSHRRFLRDSKRRLFVSLRSPSRVAVVKLEGPIGVERRGTGIALEPTRRLIRRLSEDPRVAGVLLHIDSPGGSAIASELLHREITRLDEKKPVVAWLGNVAASGGYYLAVATRHITAQPTTITGSIGVISARPVTTGLLSKLGVQREVVKLAPFADLHSLRALDGQETALVKAETRRYYERFLEVVAAGRRRSPAEVEPLAGGRVWSGADAHARGLVDALGGYAEARAALDAMLAERHIRVADEPWLFEPTARPEWLTALGAYGLRVEASPFHDGAGFGELWALLQTGERVLAYAHELPTFR